MNETTLAIKYEDKKLFVLDQRLIPTKEVYVEIKNIQDGFDAIADMKVRGAPLIGFTAILSMAVWCRNPESKNLDEAIGFLSESRPTAVNLFFELKKVKKLINDLLAQNPGKAIESIADSVFQFGLDEIEQSTVKHLIMAKIGETTLTNKFGNKKLKILTHCNTGWLACGSMGTALGVISHLASKNKIEKVWVDETRPYLQGSRLTAFELGKEKINHEIVVEGAASLLMKNKLVDAIFVGADRIASNGDTANKIGTANLSILAKYYDIPFYIVAPVSTFDLAIENGEQIKIEYRSPNEIKNLGTTEIAPKASNAFNPSFDVSDAINITGIICERGLISPVSPVTVEEIINGN